MIIAELVFLVVVFMLWSRTSRLDREVTVLKKRLDEGQVSTSTASVSLSQNAIAGENGQTNGSVPNPEWIVEQPTGQTAQAQKNKLDDKNPLMNPIGWFKENWLLKVGVLLILAGFGWFISYVFVHNWIGPLGRVALGLITGSILALVGYIRMPKSSTQGKMFLILGSAMVIITSYAAQAVYDYFNAPISLAIVFLVSVYISTVALQFKMKSIAIYGVVIALLAPLLTHASVDINLLFPYITVVALATVWLASVKGWREMNAVSILAFAYYAFPYLLRSPNYISGGEQNMILFVVFGLGLVYFLVSVFGAIKNQEKTNSSDIFVAVVDSLLVIFATINFLPSEIQSIVLAVWMVVFAIGSFAVFSSTNNIKFFYVYSLISVTLLAIATSIELEGSALVYAFALESAVISIAGYLVTRKLSVGYSLSSLMIVPVFMSMPSVFSNKWENGFLHDDFGILVLMGILFLSLGLLYYYSEMNSRDSRDAGKNFYVLHLILGSAYLLSLIWLSNISIFDDQSTSVLVSLVIYTLLGIFAYFYGLIKNKETLKHCGAVLLALVIARLVLVDVWDMELSKRIVTFVSIGILFISTAFIGKKVKEDTGAQGGVESVSN